MLFCRHNYKFVRRLYGDEINIHNGKRNEYICEKCGKYKYDNQKIDTCDHCKHLYYNNDGSVACDSPYESTCLTGNVRMYKEPTE